MQVVDGVGAAPDFDPLGFDWRFHEFSNAIQLTLYSICIEIMTLRTEPQEVGQRLFSLVTNIEATGIPIEVHDQPKVTTTLPHNIRLIYIFSGSMLSGLSSQIYQFLIPKLSIIRLSQLFLNRN